MALVTAFEKTPTIYVMARGRAISSAVDVVEVTKRSFIKDMIVDAIEISTEQMGTGDDIRNVSVIKITLNKPPGE